MPTQNSSRATTRPRRPHTISAQPSPSRGESGRCCSAALRAAFTLRRNSTPTPSDALKWFKPAKGQFQIYYKLGTEQPEYIPDFVAEAQTAILMVETKAQTDVDTPVVQAKADAAAIWCKQASDYAATVGGKPWKYLLL